MLVFQSGSLPPDTEVTIVNVRNAELDCSLNTTRFVPFGYKDILFDPPLPGPIDPPARIYWQIATRFVSLEQIKFATTPSKGTNASDFARFHKTTFECLCSRPDPSFLYVALFECLLLNRPETMTVKYLLRLMPLRNCRDL